MGTLRHLWTAAVILILWAGLSAAPARTAMSAAPWPTREFKVIHHSPDRTDVEAVRDQLTEWFTPDGDAASRALADEAWSRLAEGYLAEIAGQLEAAGFRAPPMPRIQDQGRTKFVVYLFDFSEWKRASGSGHVYSQNGQEIVSINRTKFSAAYQANTGITSRAREVSFYWALAHELFHAIQGGYGYGLRYGEALIEGTADGVARYLVARTFPGHVERHAGQTEMDTTGAYPYYTGFLLDPLDHSRKVIYRTSSFWFHLAERFGGLSVIASLLEQPFEGSPAGDSNMVRWLERGLRAKPEVNEGLYTIYPHFLTELASYGGGRRYAQIGDARWLEWVLGRCAGVTMTPETEGRATHALEFFGKMAGVCAKVGWSGFPDNAALRIEVEFTDRDVLDQINLGVAMSTQSGGSCWKWLTGLEASARPQATCLLEKPRILTGPTDRTWVKTWELPPAGYGPSGDATFVLTNAAVRPWETKVADGLTIRFGFARTEDLTGSARGPAEAEHMRVPTPSPGHMRQRSYGINPDPPLPDTALTPPVPPITIPRGDGSSGVRAINDPRFRVTADPREPIPPGYTGPFFGLVELVDPGQPAGAARTASLFCGTEREERTPIGRVLVAEMYQLKVHVQADLCRWEFGRTAPFPVVERLDAIVVLPFGWRYRKHPPRDVVTPGIEIFIDRFHARTQGLLRGHWPFGGPVVGPVPAPGTGGPTGPGTAGISGAATAAGQAPAPCDCSCEAFQKFQELSRRRRDPEAQEQMKAQAACAVECLSKWMACPPQRIRR